MSKKSKSDKAVSSSAKVSDDRVYELFVHFLHSPVWQLPVMSFIEQRSIVFDKENRNDQLFKEEHEQFRQLVDFLIESFCEDIGITPIRVTTALTADKLSERRRQKMEIFEPVIAVQDYELFVAMMTRKNIELQLQALQMIEFMCGVLPAVLRAAEEVSAAQDKKKSGSKSDSADGHEEHVILMRVMNQSKDEFEKQSKNELEWQKELQLAIKESAQEKHRLEHLRDAQLELERRTMSLSLNDNNATASSGDGTKNGGTGTKDGGTGTTAEADANVGSSSITAPLSAARANRDDTSSSSAKLPAKKRPSSKQGRRASNSHREIGEAQPSAGKQQSGDNTTSAADVAQRQTYLRAQRDKLMRMKQEARQKAFMDAEHDAATTQRPKTASAARSALRGQSARSRRLNDEVLTARRALADKLKAELL